MEPIKKNDAGQQTRIDCAHCKGTGTCHSSREGASCFVCIRAAKVKEFTDVQFGLVCSVCEGNGYNEPFSERLQERIGPMLALALCYLTLVLVFFAVGKSEFDKVLPFSATIIGSVTGFYFGSRPSRRNS